MVRAGRRPLARVAGRRTGPGQDAPGPRGGRCRRRGRCSRRGGWLRAGRRRLARLCPDAARLAPYRTHQTRRWTSVFRLFSLATLWSLIVALLCRHVAADVGLPIRSAGPSVAIAAVMEETPKLVPLALIGSSRQAAFGGLRPPTGRCSASPRAVGPRASRPLHGRRFRTRSCSAS